MISSYFEKVQQYSPARFILEVTALAFVSRFLLTLPAAILLASFGVNLGDPNVMSFDFTKGAILLILYICIIAPFFETLIFQWIPLSILNLFRLPFWVKVVPVALLFAYAHLHEGLINFIGMIPIAFLLVWAFAVQQRKSTKLAIFTVFIIHGLSNLIALLLYFFTS